MMDRLFLDVMLGKLATYLRMCGYDAAYALDRGVEDDDVILELAESEDRTLLTRDVELAGRSEDAICIESLDVEDQLEELREHGFSLSLSEPARCSDCNGRLVREREGKEIPEHVPDGKRVWRCRDCGKLFWKGSHWESVEETLSKL
ncbi:Mut7-C RNAse domain-containing protein [Haladaptatus sp. AB643]|uniref:Mut7-C RNAse domain-containing protein n=1 Tax=Haladaptatus sp. AB643 TaxID=2934174 RepID=UPI00209BE1AD|nr:Mut7-C RNAse domain-containing protein [Haladaptatus sp. AB643]MCO8244269.1 Mut7-C RNAse domain-containing protein [Haladaptatus sp. AB643]